MAREKRVIEMTTGSLWKNILLFSLPLMLTQVLEVLFNLSDVAIAGKFADYRALGAVGSTTLLVSLFPVLLLISAGLFISGTVIHNKYMYYVSCFLLPVAFGIIRESWINVNPDGNLIQFAVAVLVGLAGSGYALKRQVKRDAAEASENR